MIIKMTGFLRKGGLFLILLISLVACKDRNEYRVDPAFADYLQRFETLAATRGKYFDLKANGIIIEFADLKDNTAGLTHYEDPIRIEIDRTYWNDITGYAGEDEMKEDLIFHELGHGLLDRKHLNSTLENGDWKSIMCGGDKVGDRPWNINYRGMRRDYYINELFDESTAAPDFSKNQLTVDTTGFTPTVRVTVNPKDVASWKITEDSQHKTSIDNGRLKFESKINGSFLVYAITPAPIDFSTDFSFEFSIQYSMGETTDQYGMIYGSVPDNSNGVNDSVEYLLINNNQKMYMGNRSWYSFYTELSKPSIIANGNNKLKIIKIGTLQYYFINDVYTYCSEIETTGSGDHFGFVVPSKGTVWIDNFTISQKTSAGVVSKVKSNAPVEFEMVSAGQFNQHTVKNR